MSLRLKESEAVLDSPGKSPTRLKGPSSRHVRKVTRLCQRRLPQPFPTELQIGDVLRPIRLIRKLAGETQSGVKIRIGGHVRMLDRPASRLIHPLTQPLSG